MQFDVVSCGDGGNDRKAEAMTVSVVRAGLETLDRLKHCEILQLIVGTGLGKPLVHVQLRKPANLAIVRTGCNTVPP